MKKLHCFRHSLRVCKYHQESLEWKLHHLESRARLPTHNAGCQLTLFRQIRHLLAPGRKGH